MSGQLAARSDGLLRETRAVFEAVQNDASREAVDRLVERQREAFSDFSRVCDVELPLDAPTRSNIDEVLRLDGQIVALLGRACKQLAEQSRAVSDRKSRVRAFSSRSPEPPRFVERHV